jgi:L-lysine 2,3-aminomutase
VVQEKKLLEIINSISKIKQVKRLRIHSRVPIASPERVTPTLIEGLKKLPLVVSMVIHMNHPAEMDHSVEKTLKALIDSGIPLYNQSVLLKGVNDTAKTLTTLSETLLQARVTPYYLHLLDPVMGAAHFYVGRKKGRKLIKKMRNRLPGFGVPLLVQEIPGEKSKIPV